MLKRIKHKNDFPKLRSFVESITRCPCLAEETFFNIAWNCLGITFGLLWFVVVINIIRPNAI